VERGGFEPPKASPTDLQSVPFGRSGTSPAFSAYFFRLEETPPFKKNNGKSTAYISGIEAFQNPNYINLTKNPFFVKNFPILQLKY
jgi:hypothetical protein